MEGLDTDFIIMQISTHPQLRALLFTIQSFRLLLIRSLNGTLSCRAVTCGFLKRISHFRLIIGDRAETERQGEGDISHFDFFEKFFKA